MVDEKKSVIRKEFKKINAYDNVRDEIGKKAGEEIKIVEGLGWIWLVNKRIKNYESESKAITGKYLFFSPDKKKLIKLAKTILITFNLYVAKVPLSDKPVGNDFCLCVYDKEPRFKNEMKSYADEINIKYRYWKSNEDTRNGKYSKEFLSHRTPENKLFG